MPTATAIRRHIEAALADKIPSALTPAPRMIFPVASTGIEPLDCLLGGGVPVGALTELTGAECTGRTSIALSFLARVTQSNRVCAWVDVSDNLDPASAAAAGVDLSRLLWVRCGALEEPRRRATAQFVLPEKYFVPRAHKRGLHGGGFGPHPRTEVNGMPDAVGDLLRPNVTPRCAEPIRNSRSVRQSFETNVRVASGQQKTRSSQPWNRIGQALRSTDLILQSGGFAAIVLDMAGLLPAAVSAIELSTWHRYRVAAERTRTSILILSQHACAKSSSALQLRLGPAEDIADEATVFTGIRPRAEVSRHRFAQPEINVVPMRKPPQRETSACWQSRTTWAGTR
jgi:recombination protein RecA